MRSAIRMGRSRASLMRVCSSPMKIRTIRMDFGRVDDSQHSENLSGALLVPRGAALFVQTKDRILQRLEGFEQFVHSGIKICLSPVFFAAQMRGQAETPAPIKSGKPIRMADAIPKSSPLWGRKFQTKITTHRSPIQKVRFVESGNLTTRELIMAGQFVKQPGL